MTDDVHHEEIQKLLPWYVTGRLDRADRNKVESYLRQHPDVAGQLSLIREEREGAIHANESLRLSALRHDRALHVIATCSPPRSMRFSHALLDDLHCADRTQRTIGRNCRQRHCDCASRGDCRFGIPWRQSRLPGSIRPAHTGSFSALVAFLRRRHGGVDRGIAPRIQCQHRRGPQARRRLQDSVGAFGGSQDMQLRKLAERRDVIRIVLPGGIDGRVQMRTSHAARVRLSSA